MSDAGILALACASAAWCGWRLWRRLDRRLEALDDCGSRTDVWQTAEISKLKQALDRYQRDTDQANAEHDAAHADLLVKTAEHLAAHAQNDVYYAEAQVAQQRRIDYLLERVVALERTAAGEFNAAETWADACVMGGQCIDAQPVAEGPTQVLGKRIRAAEARQDEQ